MKDRLFMVDVKYRPTHDDNEEWEVINHQKRGRLVKMSDIDIPMKYSEPSAIPQKKLDDIKSLLSYVPPIYHNF